MKEAFIRKNTQELRDKLEAMGCYICCCATWNDSKWLDTDINGGKVNVHGVGFYDETYPAHSVEEALNFFLYENEHSDNPAVDCGEDEEMFLRLAQSAMVRVLIASCM